VESLVQIRMGFCRGPGRATLLESPVTAYIPHCALVMAIAVHALWSRDGRIFLPRYVGESKTRVRIFGSDSVTPSQVWCMVFLP